MEKLQLELYEKRVAAEISWIALLLHDPVLCGLLYKVAIKSKVANTSTEANMFGMKSKKEKLEIKLAKLLEEVYKLSHTNRRQSDEKAAEAEELRKQIDAME